MLLVLPIYFLLAVCLAALVLLPSVRHQVGALLRSVVGGALRRAERFNRNTSSATRHTALKARERAHGFANVIARHRWLLGGTFAVIVLPSIAVLTLGPRPSFTYEDNLSGPDARTRALLSGERLVPPPPLPPEVFTTREVELVRPNLGGASREWNLLDPDFRQHLLLVYKIMREEHGYEMVLLEGYRSPERQNQLAAIGSNVTNARAFQSYHQFGLAADNAFLRNGKIVISEKDPWAMRGYELYGQVAQSVGLTWGGSWKMMDLGHVELRKPGVMQRARAAQQSGTSE